MELDATGTLPGRAGAPAGPLDTLAGYTVAVAAHRGRDPLGPYLEEAGARVQVVQAVQMVPQPDDTGLYGATRSCLARPVDEVIISSANGFRGWLAAARRWGLADQLVAQLGAARLLVRNGYAADSLRAVGLYELWSTDAETIDDLFRYLLAQDLTGRRLAVQLDDTAAQDLCQRARDAGADVVEVPMYRWAEPRHPARVRRLVDLVTRRAVDALAFTSAPAVLSLFAQAAQDGRTADLLDALRTDVTPACLGPVSGAPLTPHRLRPIHPDRSYPQDLAAALTATLPATAVKLRAAGHDLEIRGNAVVLDGDLVPLPSGPLAVLRALAVHPGRVLSRAELRESMPTWAGVDDHAIEMAVSRLRRALHDTDLVQTVMRRGYRLGI